ncbi:MAG: carboxypeptidase M32 [Gammaproteobacteria bacterium]|nr:MAG: carboxypeptidase M32 [Gammaproteobacteria bacterium]
MTPYEALENSFRDISHLLHVSAVLYWDEATMMPLGGGSARANAMAALAGILHERITAPEIGDLLDQARSSADDLGVWERANLHQMERTWSQNTALPHELVKAIQLAATTCEQTWRACRPSEDWTTVLPKLESLFKLQREVAEYMGEQQGLAPYDALLDSYEEGLRANFVDETFADLKAFLPGFLEKVLERQAQKPPLPLPGPFPLNQQEQLGLKLVQTLGFDFEHGRLDVSHHPFCGGVPDDTRITTRYTEDDFLHALMGSLHETGHALYQQGLPAQWREQPVGEALGMAIHESQSLLMEMQVCRGRSFLNYAAGAVREAFGASADDPVWSGENLHRHYTRVERGYIRVDADEVTYPLHIILRYEIEKQLFSGQLELRDLPDAWDEGMKSLLGLSTAGNLKDGVMQDVHWFGGLFGYFPSYTLGAITAAQLFATARREIDGLSDSIERGDFTPLVGWLRSHVHGQGRLMNADVLVRNVTGEPLTTAAFKSHLQARYLPD